MDELTVGMTVDYIDFKGRILRSLIVQRDVDENDVERLNLVHVCPEERETNGFGRQIRYEIGVAGSATDAKNHWVRL